MQIHGPSETVDRITVRANLSTAEPYAVLELAGTAFFLESAADADELIRAATEAKNLLLSGTDAS